MKRAAITLLAVLSVGVTAFAKPPVERPVYGKERTSTDRDLYTPEAPPAAETAPGLPSHGWQTVVQRFVFGPLGVVPLLPRSMW